ncbi:MAG: hypothetical protein QOC81_4804 [Thermoanaerobaculia bacterium]|jgi:hypothetical protein|nr:hypothetical protein [Thermoanaerobaculia bacterium]
MTSSRDVRKSAAAVALATLFFYSAFVFVQVRRHAFNPSVFVIAGDEFTDKSAPAGLLVAPNSSGYDGQFYYRIACDPFSTQAVVAGVHFDYPVYRLQRIGYPLLVWILSFGNRAAVPWLLIVVNLAALAGIGAVAVLATRDLRVPAWSCLALALYPGFLLSLSRDLVEPLEVFLIILALLLLQRNRVLAAACVLVLAALTKETSLLFALGALVSGLMARPRRWIYLMFLGPFAAHLAWKVILFRLWHLPMTFVTGEHFMSPFSGFLTRAREAVSSGGAGRTVLIEMAMLVAFGFIVSFAFRSSLAPNAIKVAWLLYAALVFTLGTEFWWEDWAFLRVAVEFALLGGLIAMTSPRWRLAAQSVLTVGWIALAWNVLFFRG